MDSKLELKSINEILNYNFFIPSYQRGYRWGKEQVLKLLEDILEFSKVKNKEEFYPLQPIVVFKDNNRYELIDGQQRITTIYIIFVYLKNMLETLKKKQDKLKDFQDIIGVCFGKIDRIKDKMPSLKNLIYERDKNKNILDINFEKLCIENPDCYYMSGAYLSIKAWFQANNINIENFITTILNHTRVIWYEISNVNEEEKRDIFTRLNIGKIELTNAELIRALLLNDIKEYKQKIEIGYELDKIEYSLQNELFWYFIADKDKDTKIDIVYELLADTYYKQIDKNIQKRFDKKLDKKYSFYVFEYMLNNDKKSKEEIISDIEKYFRYLEEWFLDKDFFHKIGYLLTINIKIKLLDFIEKYDNSNKDEFKKYLDNLIKKGIKDINIDDIKYGKDSAKIRKILLLFNIQTILENNNITYKFDFRKFKNRKSSDDIEHIRSQTTPNITGKKREEWIETILKYYYGYKKANNSKNIKKLAKVEIFEKFYKKISEKLDKKDLNENLKDDIGNLTLLDSKINRSYGNAFFPIKRAIILEEDRKGTFLPPCTKNVFLKTYSNKLNDMMEWNENDIKNHKEAIKEMLKNYME